MTQPISVNTVPSSDFCNCKPNYFSSQCRLLILKAVTHMWCCTLACRTSQKTTIHPGKIAAFQPCCTAQWPSVKSLPRTVCHLVVITSQRRLSDSYNFSHLLKGTTELSGDKMAEKPDLEISTLTQLIQPTEKELHTIWFCSTNHYKCCMLYVKQWLSHSPGGLRWENEGKC